ncbi:MAG: ATP-binding protein [Planctomycetes bacterium]|nr:ATP-binding protein [Planctomycetota bacterium]
MKIALTGGPHSGKTTLLAELAARGFATVPEAAFSVIEELVAELGRDEARAWRLTHVPQFQERIAQRQLQLECAARQESAAAVFCDRGLVDGLAYMRLVGAPPTPFVKAAVASSRYDLIVLCEICLPFKPRIETGRTSDLRRAREIEASLVATYRELGYEPLRLPAEAPAAARADLLLDELSHHGLVARTR